MVCEIKIEGEIGSDVTLESVRAQIDHSATSYDILIDSTGGEVFTGESIYNELVRLKKPKTTIITGLCASIATLIAGAGDKIKMYDVGHFMIHNPSVGLEGDAGALRKAAGTLDQIKQILAMVYGRRTAKAGVGKQQLWDMMEEETWMLPEEAKEKGFIDEVIPSHSSEEVMNKLRSRELKAVARMDFKKFNMKDDKDIKTGMAKLTAQVANMFKMFKSSFKNNLNLILEDGTPIIVVTEDETWQGKQVTFEDGTPLQPGMYITSEGVEFMVGEGSLITEVKEAAAADETKEEDMKPEEALKMKQENEALKKELETLKATVQTKEKESATVAANMKKFEANLKDVQAKLKEYEDSTAGDQGDPGKDGLGKDGKSQREADGMGNAMAELGEAWLSSHGYKAHSNN